MLEAPPLTASTPSGFVADALRHFHELRPRLNALPWQVIHNDANDHNVIVSADRRTVSLIDFGDIVYAPRVCGLAVACAYAMLGQAEPGARDPAARRRLPRGGAARCRPSWRRSTT